jgi:NhaA family Na+:H+ antiporter
MKKKQSAFLQFFSAFRTSGVLLVIATLISLIAANSAIGEGYRAFWESSFGAFVFNKSNLTLINDGLMAVFFLLVGLEIKRELVNGELSSPKNALLPLVAAIGGMLVPSIIFFALNCNATTANGWGIPMATDIAFALAILSVAGKKVPVGLKVFLTAVAIIDDLGAILVIAIFYAHSFQLFWLLVALAPIILLFLLNKFRHNHLLSYLVSGIALWYCIYKSGIHPTVAGVLLAFFIPISAKSSTSLSEKLEHQLEGVVKYFVLPLFALANTAILIDAPMMVRLPGVLAEGIILGLFLGKPIGISLFSLIAVKTGIASYPSRTSIKHIVAAGILGGIGFTMSIFISMLAFSETALQETAKVAVLIASVLAGITGVLVLKKAIK